jgi:hypothetical protein
MSVNAPQEHLSLKAFFTRIKKPTGACSVGQSSRLAWLAKICPYSISLLIMQSIASPKQTIRVWRDPSRRFCSDEYSLVGTSITKHQSFPHLL